MTPTHVIDVSAAIGWDIVERCGGGEFGAYLVERRGERAILKVWPNVVAAREVAQSIELANRARERGQLVPRYLDVGLAAEASYCLQEFVDGSIPEPLTLTHARQMIERLEAHKDAAVGVDYERPHWWRPWDRTVLLDGDDDRLRRLADEMAAVTPIDELDRRTTDVEHGDYHHRNLLTRGAKVVAVFDWEGAHPGDWRADLFKLTWWSAAATSQVTRPAARWLETQARAMLSDQELAGYAVHVALWLLDFYRRTRPDLLDWAIPAVESGLASLWRRTTTV